ncbi:MAG TPA: SGNH/GDSL hydrolase family protein, partial [Phycisphaerae bacterium]|nr:SGNH/GDSL hydrolase family protein [Phycisphaerae bacterium]
MNWRKFFRKATPLIGVNLSGIAVIFALFELTLRAVGWVDTGSPYPPRGSVVHRTSEFEVTYRYNDRGFRSDTDFRPFEQAGAPPPDVVAIGDSFTEGFGVESTQTFSAELERILRRRNPAARVLNLGISGTGPNDYARVFAYALRLRPRAIVIGFFVGNDAAESRPPRAPSRWRTVQFLDGKIRTARRLLNPSPFRSGLVGTAYRWWVCRNAGISTEEFQRRYERLAPELRRLVDDEKINFHLVLLGLLQPDAIYNNLALADRASREGLQHADILFRAMRQECERRGIALHIAAIPASVQVSA